MGGDGVSAMDGRNGAEFQLRAWVTMVTGDGPALAEAICMKRPGNAVRPCRTCMIKAELASRTYYVPHSEYDFENPPLRSDLRQMIERTPMIIAKRPALLAAQSCLNSGLSTSPKVSQSTSCTLCSRTYRRLCSSCGAEPNWQLTNPVMRTLRFGRTIGR